RKLKEVCQHVEHETKDSLDLPSPVEAAGSRPPRSACSQRRCPACSWPRQGASTGERKFGTHLSLAAGRVDHPKALQGRWSQNFRWPVLGDPEREAEARALLRERFG